MTETPQPSHSAARTLARALLWPLTRFFDPRFLGIAAHVEASRRDLVARLDRAQEDSRALEDQLVDLREANAELHRLAELDMEMSSDAVTLLGEAIAGVARTSEETFGLVTKIRMGDDALTAHVEDVVQGRAPLDPALANFLNHAGSHRGFAAKSNLWFNPPISLTYEDGGVTVGDVNERIVEIPYVLRALARVPVGARVLDVGATESPLALFLASSGYQVTAIDVRPYPLAHPQLEIVTAPIEKWETNQRFDAVACLSTIEHIGLGAYGEQGRDGRSDLDAMRRIRELAAPGATLVLTTPFGESHVDEFSRVYDGPALEKLLEGWRVDDLTLATRSGESSWTIGGDPADGVEGVALVTAVRGDD